MNPFPSNVHCPVIIPFNQFVQQTVEFYAFSGA